MPMSDVGVQAQAQRVQALFAAAPYRSQRELAKRAGIPATRLNDALKGRCALSRKNAVRLAAALGTTAGYLVFGERPGSATAADSEGAARVVTAGAGEEAGEVAGAPFGSAAYTLPIIGSAAADTSGGTRIFDDYSDEDAYEFPATRLLVRVRGDSMAPLAEDGQFAVLTGPERSPRSGDLVAVLTRQRGLLFKRLYIPEPLRRRGVAYELHSVNPVARLQPVIVPAVDIVDMRVVIGVLYE